MYISWTLNKKRGPNMARLTNEIRKQIINKVVANGALSKIKECKDKFQSLAQEIASDHYPKEISEIIKGINK